MPAQWASLRPDTRAWLRIGIQLYQLIPLKAYSFWILFFCFSFRKNLLEQFFVLTELRKEGGGLFWGWAKSSLPALGKRLQTSSGVHDSEVTSPEAGWWGSSESWVLLTGISFQVINLMHLWMCVKVSDSVNEYMCVCTGEGCIHVYSFNSFNNYCKISTECVLCTRYCPRSLGYNSGQNEDPCPLQPYIRWGLCVSSRDGYVVVCISLLGTHMWRMKNNSTRADLGQEPSTIFQAWIWAKYLTFLSLSFL